MTKEQEARPVPFRFEEVAERAREAALAHGGHLPTLLVEDAPF